MNHNTRSSSSNILCIINEKLSDANFKVRDWILANLAEDLMHSSIQNERRNCGFLNAEMQKIQQIQFNDSVCILYSSNGFDWKSILFVDWRENWRVFLFTTITIFIDIVIKDGVMTLDIAT